MGRESKTKLLRAQFDDRNDNRLISHSQRANNDKNLDNKSKINTFVSNYVLSLKVRCIITVFIVIMIFTTKSSNNKGMVEIVDRFYKEIGENKNISEVYKYFEYSNLKYYYNRSVGYFDKIITKQQD